MTSMRPRPASAPVARAGRSVPVIVGAAPGADDAIAWASRHARRHGAPVHLIRAYEPGNLWPGGVASALGVPRAGLRDVLARTTLTRARRLARSGGRPADEDPVVRVVEGRPVDVLLEAARGASMLVVGHRPRPAEAVWDVGSVALGVLRHATTAVTVVRSAPDDGPVLIGIDGSPSARHALRHALADAAVRGERTIVVVAGTPVAPEWAHAQVADVANTVRLLGIAPGPIDVVAHAGSPARSLLDVAARRRAALVVVGHRGRRRTASMLLGSVGRELVARAPIPVTVVCPEAPAGEDGTPTG